MHFFNVIHVDYPLKIDYYTHYIVFMGGFVSFSSHPFNFNQKQRLHFKFKTSYKLITYLYQWAKSNWLQNLGVSMKSEGIWNLCKIYKIYNVEDILMICLINGECWGSNLKAYLTLIATRWGTAPSAVQCSWACLDCFMQHEAVKSKDHHDLLNQAWARIFKKRKKKDPKLWLGVNSCKIICSKKLESLYTAHAHATQWIRRMLASHFYTFGHCHTSLYVQVGDQLNTLVWFKPNVSVRTQLIHIQNLDPFVKHKTQFKTQILKNPYPKCYVWSGISSGPVRLGKLFEKTDSEAHSISFLWKNLLVNLVLSVLHSFL